MTVTLYSALDNSVIGTWRQTTDDVGGVTVVPQVVLPSLVNVKVKQDHALSIIKRNVPYPWVGNSLSMGTMLEGDANDNDVVDAVDFSLLRTHYAEVCPACDDRVDFSENGTVDAVDFSLLLTNYTKGGPVTTLAGGVTAQGFGDRDAQKPTGGATLKLVPSSTDLSSEAAVAIDVVIESWDQPVDAVQVNIRFDPQSLRIVDESGRPVASIIPGDAMPVVLQNTVNEGDGRISFGAGTLASDPPQGTIIVARFYVRPTDSSRIGRTGILISSEEGIRTDVIFAGESVLLQTSNARLMLLGVGPRLLGEPVTITGSGADQ